MGMGIPSPSDPLGLRPPPLASSHRAKTYEVIFEHQTRAGRAFDVALIVAMLESVASVRVVYGPLLRSLEWGFTVAFTVEYALRLWCVDRPVRYARSFLGMVDLLAVLPTYLSVLLPGGQVLTVVRILRVLRVLRILKLAQYTGEARVLGGGHAHHRGLRRHHAAHAVGAGLAMVVRVPAGVELIGTMVSGDIRAEGLRSQVRANTVNGDIYVSTSEKAWGNTVSGSIEIAMGSMDWTDLDFKTVSGDIDSDFDITMTGRQSRSWIGANVEGYIGAKGERSLSFNTISGDVRLRRTR